MNDTDITKSILYSHINFWLGMMLLGTVAFGSSLLIWHAATDINPISDAMASEMAAIK